MRLLTFSKYGARTKIVLDVDRIVSIEQGEGVHGALSKVLLDTGQECLLGEKLGCVVAQIRGDQGTSSAAGIEGHTAVRRTSRRGPAAE